MPQYFKLRKKVEAGARFVINQIGWNARKDDELLRWIRREELPVSVLANVYLLSPAAARAFHQGKIPGVVVTDELLALAERHGASPDKGRAFFVDQAAKHVAIARGLGFDGVYLGGHMPASTFGEILDQAAAFAERRLAGVRVGDPLSGRGRVLLLRARPGDEALVGRGERGVPRVEAQAEDRAARAAQVPLQPAAPRRRVRAGRAALSGRARRSTGRSTRLRRPGRPPTRSSRPPRCRSSAAATAATARFPTSPTSVPSRSARRTSATGRAAARATACARSTTPSASGRRPMRGSRRTARRNRCWTAR